MRYVVLALAIFLVGGLVTAAAIRTTDRAAVPLAATPAPPAPQPWLSEQTQTWAVPAAIVVAGAAIGTRAGAAGTALGAMAGLALSAGLGMLQVKDPAP